uniref:Uncharacterized protein n=1 Tax=Steinernema glaseri TaxID=37863 RepID=A0A1I7ZXM1_9BILA
MVFSRTTSYSSCPNKAFKDIPFEVNSMQPCLMLVAVPVKARRHWDLTSTVPLLGQEEEVNHGLEAHHVPDDTEVLLVLRAMTKDMEIAVDL